MAKMGKSGSDWGQGRANGVLARSAARLSLLFSAHRERCISRFASPGTGGVDTVTNDLQPFGKRHRLIVQSSEGALLAYKYW
jgi:hypothetical protein